MRKNDVAEISVYDIFVRSAREMLQQHADADVQGRYEYLKNNGYIVRDEVDLCIYVVKVAHKHKEKFQQLYRQLFLTKILSRYASLVVWGCGCGLDILALYDESIAEKDPELWINVQNITLIDASQVALDCASELATTLFPQATVKSVKVDLKNKDELEGLPQKVLHPDGFLRCVHLLSNILDLFQMDDVRSFAETVMSVSYRFRRDGHRILLDDTYVAFSPTYQNAGRKIDTFRSVFSQSGLKCSIVNDLDIVNCAYCWFSAVSQKSDKYKALFSALPFFNELRGEFSFARVDASEQDKEELRHLSNAFTTFVSRFTARSLCEYDAVELRWATCGGNVRKPYIVLYPTDGTHGKILIAFDSQDETCKWNLIRDWAVARLAPEKCSEFRQLYGALNPSSEGDRDTRWHCSEFFKYLEAVQLSSNSTRWQLPRGDSEDEDLSSILYYKNVPEIPSLPTLSASQKEIAVDRKQFRKVRGGPGTGKSVTMLWCAINAAVRSHMPVLILCKTNSLFNYTRQMLANTLLEKLGVRRFRRDLIRFSTVANFICEERKSDRDYTCGVRRGMSHDEVKSICQSCKGNWCGNADTVTATHFGSVLVDEMQIQDPCEIRGVFNAVLRKNPNCNFYAFCDEQQSFRGMSALEQGVEGDRTDRLIVKMPAPGFGRYKTLKTGFRYLKAPKIRELCEFLQARMSEKYDVSELKMYAAQGESNLITHQLECCRISTGEGIGESVGRWMQSVFCGISEVSAKCALVFDSKKGAVVAGNLQKCGISESILERCRFTEVWCTHNSNTERNNDLARRQRTRLYDRVGTFLCTTVDCAQGQTFSNVILVLSSSRENDWETLFTGVSRASERVFVIDSTPSGWVAEILRNRGIKIVERKRDGIKNQDDMDYDDSICCADPRKCV